MIARGAVIAGLPTASIRSTARRARVGDVGIDVDLVFHVGERVADPLQRDALHVRAQVAGPHELGVGDVDGDVVAHRAFGDHDDLVGRLDLDVVDHAARAADEVGFVEHIRRALGVGDDLRRRGTAVR